MKRTGIPPLDVWNSRSNLIPTCRSSAGSALRSPTFQPRNVLRPTFPSCAYRFRTLASPTRTPYGGFVTIHPFPPAGSTAEIAKCDTSMSASTPARSAFSNAARTAPASRSDARITPGALGSSVSRRRCLRSSQRPSSKWGQCSNAKLRFCPGAIFLARSAASIAIVPEPQSGSTRGACWSHPLASNMAAASVSRIGALAVACR